MSKPVARAVAAGRWSTYSDLRSDARAACLSACRALTEAVYPGLDVQSEIRAIARQQIGDTVLIHDGVDLVGFAVCHLGAGSEAGTGAAYVKFADRKSVV